MLVIFNTKFWKFSFLYIPSYACEDYIIELTMFSYIFHWSKLHYGIQIIIIIIKLLACPFLQVGLRAVYILKKQ